MKSLAFVPFCCSPSLTPPSSRFPTLCLATRHKVSFLYRCGFERQINRSRHTSCEFTTLRHYTAWTLPTLTALASSRQTGYHHHHHHHHWQSVLRQSCLYRLILNSWWSAPKKLLTFLPKRLRARLVNEVSYCYGAPFIATACVVRRRRRLPRANIILVVNAEEARRRGGDLANTINVSSSSSSSTSGSSCPTRLFAHLSSATRDQSP